MSEIMIDADISVVDAPLLDHLRAIAASHPKRRARISFSKPQDWVQEMIICLMRGSYVRAHRHPYNKTESYHVIQGALNVTLYDIEGGLHRNIVLNDAQPFYRLRNGWYHEPKAMTECCIYHETYQGPYDKHQDYWPAPWAKEEE